MDTGQQTPVPTAMRDTSTCSDSSPATSALIASNLELRRQLLLANAELLELHRRREIDLAVIEHTSNESQRMQKMQLEVTQLLAIKDQIIGQILLDPKSYTQLMDHNNHFFQPTTSSVDLVELETIEQSLEAIYKKFLDVVKKKAVSSVATTVSKQQRETVSTVSQGPSHHEQLLLRNIIRSHEVTITERELEIRELKEENSALHHAHSRLLEQVANLQDDGSACSYII